MPQGSLGKHGVLPDSQMANRQLSLTIVGVTALSTAAMIIYPAIMNSIAVTNADAAIFIGATIHDVAEVVGAGYSMNEPVGELATLFLASFARALILLF